MPFFVGEMNQVLNIAEQVSPCAGDWQQPSTLIIGAGPVGQRLAMELRKLDADREIVVFGDEPWAPYDRVQLSSWLAEGFAAPADTTLSNDCCLHLQLGTRITAIDRENRRLVDERGKHWSYDKLVLATGSRAFIPPIPGTGLEGVYTFRNLSDAQRLMARTVRSRATVVIGGGLLGLETARALRRFNTQVTIVEQSSRLMFHQLDEDTAAVLQEHVESLGIDIVLNTRVVSLQGDGAVQSVELSDGQVLDCDTVVIAAGITPNIELARDCGLETRRGILVDDRLFTSDPHILAVGECTEHRDTVYGLVSPGYEQAAVAAHILNGQAAEYEGSLTAASLKVIGCPVMSVGRVETEWLRRELTWRDRGSGQVRKVMLDGNRLDAAMAVGGWDEFSRAREAVRNRQRVLPWRALMFQLTGRLWWQNGEDNIVYWPAAATICNCKGITRGELSACVDSGCASVECLAEKTGASTVCGTCKPLLAQLVGATKVEPVRASGLITVAVALVGIAVLAMLLPVKLPYAETVQSGLQIDALWRNGFYKQVSGFSLLGLSVMLAALSLRKRIRRLEWGGFDSWRLLHIIAGVVTVSILAAHTGLRLGDNLNGWLMLVFTGLLAAGAAAGAAMGLQHALPLALSRRVRELSVLVHILLLWPLPALLGFHILKTYWY